MWLLRSVGEEAAGCGREGGREGAQCHKSKCALSFSNRAPCSQRLVPAAATDALKIQELCCECENFFISRWDLFSVVGVQEELNSPSHPPSARGTRRASRANLLLDLLAPGDSEGIRIRRRNRRCGLLFERCSALVMVV